MTIASGDGLHRVITQNACAAALRHFRHGLGGKAGVDMPIIRFINAANKTIEIGQGVQFRNIIGRQQS